MDCPAGQVVTVMVTTVTVNRRADAGDVEGLAVVIVDDFTEVEPAGPELELEPGAREELLDRAELEPEELDTWDDEPVKLTDELLDPVVDAEEELDP